MKPKRDLTKVIEESQKFLAAIRAIGWQEHQRGVEGDTLFKHSGTGEVKKLVDLYEAYKEHGVEAL